MDELQSFFDAYGLWLYPALFAYCALKSGALPLFAGIAAANGLLDLRWVAISTLAGGILGDEAPFSRGAPLWRTHDVRQTAP